MMAKQAVASYRRRGAHAAARRHATPFVGVKRVPQPAAGGRVPLSGGIGGLVGGLRSRSRQLKLGAAGVVVLLLIIGVAGGFASGEPSAEPAAQQFLLAWAQGQYKTAAALTTGAPATVTTALRTAYQQLGAAAYYLAMGPITQHADTAEAHFYASVDLGQDGAPWSYEGRFAMRKTPAGWRVVWSPAVINPGLRQGLRMAVVSKMPARAPLLDAEGAPLIHPSPAWIAQVRPGRLAHPEETAEAFAAMTGLDDQQVLSVIRAAPQTHPLTLVTLSPAAYATLRKKLGRVPGLVMRRVSLRLFDTSAADVTGTVGTELAPVLQAQGVTYRPGTTVGVSGLQQVYQRRLAGSAETEVIAENQGGHQVAVLKQWDGTRGTPVRTTIEAGVQRAATNAVAGQPAAAAIVAVQASTGHIIAVADRAAGGTRVDPLAGRYQPGEAFTIVSSAALLANGTGLGEQIPCPSSTRVGGRTFTNVPAVSASRRPAPVQHGLRAIVRNGLHHPVAGPAGLPAGQRGDGLRSRCPVEAAAQRVLGLVPGVPDPGRARRGHDRRTGRRGQPAGHGPRRGGGGRGEMAAADAGDLAARSRPGPAGGGRRADGELAADADARRGRLRCRPWRQPGRQPGVRAGRDGPGHGRLEVLGALVRRLPG